MKPRFHVVNPALIALVALLCLASAASALPPQQQLMAKRAAELDAYRKLAEYLSGLELESGTKVRDFLTESDQISTQFDHFLKGARISEVQHFDDGVCEVMAEVTIQQVVKTLKKICEEVYRGGKWRPETFEQIQRRTRRKIVKARGAGAVRPESVIPDPADESVVAPIVNPRGQRTEIPDIYRKFPPNRRLMARRAAELDAYRKLLERIRGLHITSSTRVRDFLAESDQIRSGVEGHIRSVQFTKVRYQPDGVVEVHAQIPITKVVKTIQRVHDDVYSGGKWKREHFDQITKQTKQHIVAVVGVGALDMAGGTASGTGGSTTQSTTTQIETETIIIE